jgi:hypothetical protein
MSGRLRATVLLPRTKKWLNLVLKAIPFFYIQTEHNGLLDPAHQLIKAPRLGMAASKIRDGGNIIAVFVLSYYDI